MSAERLHELFGHTGAYDLHQHARRQGWPITKKQADHIVTTSGFDNEIKDFLVQSQQQANLREGKVLRGTGQVDYVRLMTHTSKGWKFIMTRVEVASGLDNV